MTLLTRRAMTTAALAGTFLPGLARAQGKTPIVIGHRGCSGERPEHTALAYERAIEQGCDFIEPDLVPTKDGHLVVRHENEIGGTTDVASHPEFAARKTTKTIDGQSLTGWFTEDFTLAEIKTLRARERLPQLRPTSAAFDGQAQVLTFDEVVAIAKAATKRTGRVIGVYPERLTPLRAIDRSSADIWIVAQSLRDPGNLGTILRTGDAVGAGGLILVDDCVDPFSVEAVRASMGALFTQSIVQTRWETFLPWLREGPGQLIGTSLNTDQDYQAPAYARPAFLMVGNEAQGLPEAYEAECDLLVKMPMLGKADSLNAAVATAVMAYEILNQHRRG